MNPQSNRAGPVIFAASLFLLATGSPPKTPPHARPAVYSRYERNRVTTSYEKECIKWNCKFGLPKRRDTAPLGPSRLVFRKGYVLEHSSELRIPYWVCERLSYDDLTGRINGRLKPEPFQPDPELVRWPRALLKDYRKSGFDRGHMSPDKNRSQSKQSKAETYFLSNMVPQAGKRFNSSIWLSLEDKVREWAKVRKDCWIVSGVLMFDPKEEDPSKANGVVQYFTIGDNAVGVPTHLFKIVLAKKPGQRGENYEALAFVFENRFYDKKTPLEDYLFSIAYIEERAGFDFFPELPKDQVDEVKNKDAAVLWPGEPKSQ
jgi:DNA/RNA endonuclease G (NUC1)